MANILTEESLMRAVKNAIDSEIKAVVESAITEAQEKIRQRVPEIVAGVALKMHKFVSVQTLQNEIILHVKIDGI